MLLTQDLLESYSITPASYSKLHNSLYHLPLIYFLWQQAQKEQAAIDVDALDLGSVLGSNPELVNERDMAMQARSSTREPAPEVHIPAILKHGTGVVSIIRTHPHCNGWRWLALAVMRNAQCMGLK